MVEGGGGGEQVKFSSQKKSFGVVLTRKVEGLAIQEKFYPILRGEGGGGSEKFHNYVFSLSKLQGLHIFKAKMVRFSQNQILMRLDLVIGEDYIGVKCVYIAKLLKTLVVLEPVARNDPR